MVAKCCWRESKAEQPPPVIIETSKSPKSKTETSKTTSTSNFDPSKEKCRISLDSSFSNDSYCSGQQRLSQSFEVDCDRKLDPDNELIDLTKSGRSGKTGSSSRARSSSSSGLKHFLLLFVTVGYSQEKPLFLFVVIIVVIILKLYLFATVFWFLWLLFI
jgi:hypothetical protein